MPAINVNDMCNMSAVYAFYIKHDDSGLFLLWNLIVNSFCYLERIRHQFYLASTEQFLLLLWKIYIVSDIVYIIIY